MLTRILLLVAFQIGVAEASSADLTAADIAQIKIICRALSRAEGAPSKSDAILKRLSPYVRDTRTLSEVHEICADRCSVLVALRDNADIYFSYPDDPNARIDTVVFHHRGKTIFSIGSDGKR